MGLVVSVDVRAGLQRAGGNLGGWLTVLVRMGVRRVGGRSGERESNDIAVVLRHLGSRNPSEWSVGLGFHLNGPLCLGFHPNVPLSRWNEQALVNSGVSWRHPPFGPSASGSPGPPQTFSAAYTDLEYSENHARDGGPPSHCIYVATWSTDFGQP